MWSVIKSYLTQWNWLRRASKSILGHVWLRPLTSWSLKSNISCNFPVDLLCQLASKWVHSFSKYRVHNFGNRRKNGRTDGLTNERTDGQVENIMPPFASLAWRRHTKYPLGKIIVLFHTLKFIDVMSLTSVANVSMYLVNFVNNKVKRWYCVRYVRILLFFDIIYFTR